MKQAKMRKKIENIVNHNGIVGNYVYSDMEIINQLENLFKSEIKRIIGEDEEPYHLFAVEAPTPRTKMVCRNQFRAELRKKANL